MSTLRFRSPVTKPLLRLGTPKPVPPDPRAYDTFRVTQRFDTPDSFYAERDIRDGRVPRTHGATDVGNFRCGDAVVAMAAGTVRRVRDNATALGAATNALGVVIDHGNGITSEYWHLNAYAGPSSGPVAAGQQIGVVGRTGLGNVCHLHVEVKRNGTKIDPEPLMFGGSLTIEEDDVKIPTGKALAQGVVGPGNRLRTDPATAENSRVIGGDPPTGIGEAKAYFVQVYQFEVPGQAYTLGGKAGSTYAWVGVFGSTWFVAEPLVTNLQAAGSYLPAADCSAQEATIAQLNGRIARARTANSGAQQAQEAVKVALGG